MKSGALHILEPTALGQHVVCTTNEGIIALRNHGTGETR